ncbi:hypothetical protein L6452_29855 [Arctium lappa]|uniref:Uncharacterized protein n=1 Tax=Arctium lappa TaxID=4217 RepID=A0ACB8ZHH3_ARCLA|nr:hypothetical protein L6452_29855 [Arctium lappa]
MTSLRLRKAVNISRNIIFDVVPKSSFSRSARAFVTASKHFQKENTDEKVEQKCEEVTEAAGEVKRGFDEVSKTVKDVKGKLSEAKQDLVKRARDNVVDVATQKAKEKIIKKLK